VGVALFELELVGPFRLRAPDGCRVMIASKKAQALIAMLAMSGSGERTRSWLQGQLWGSRAANQAQASLRNELSTLRALLNLGDRMLLSSDKNAVRLDLSLINVDARRSEGTANRQGEFLEGIDILGEEGFEDWLREERTRFQTRTTVGAVAIAALSTPYAPMSSASEFATLPALAVLPFANLTGDPQLDFLAEGLSEDLIDQVSRLRWLPIIARGSSFAFRGADQDPKAAGKALGARYVLEGRIRKNAEVSQLSVGLVDCDTGSVIWSNRLDLTGYEAPDALSLLLSGMASALGTRIEQEEQSRALRKPQSDLNVRDLIWRGRWHLNRMTKEDAAVAQACFAQALIIEPNSPEAIIQSVWARVWDLWSQRGTEDQILEMRQMAQKAIIADCDDARGHMLAGIAEIWLRQPLRAESLLRRAIELNPSLSMAHAQLGASLRVRDENEQAIAAFREAIRLSPNDHDMFFVAAELAASLLLLGQFGEALVEADHSISRRRGYWFAYVIKVNALFRLGRLDDAKQTYAELLAVKSDFRPDFIQWSPFTDPKNIAFLEEGLNQVAL
jgi:TolB-like protein